MGLKGMGARLLVNVVVAILLSGTCLGQSVKGYKSSYSHSSNQRFSQNSGSSTPCERPERPVDGSISCIRENQQYKCTGTCRPGYKFPDGRVEYILVCSERTGQWSPYRNFPACEGSHGSAFDDSPYSLRETEASRFNSGSVTRHETKSTGTFSQSSRGVGSGTYRQSSNQQTSFVQCGMTPMLMNGQFSCSTSAQQSTCTGKCKPGYKFPDGTDEIILTCDGKTGQWSPSSVPSCEGSGGGGSSSWSSKTSSSGSGGGSSSWSSKTSAHGGSGGQRQWQTGQGSAGGRQWQSGHSSTGGGQTQWQTGHGSTGGGQTQWQTGHGSTGGGQRQWQTGHGSTGGGQTQWQTGQSSHGSWGSGGQSSSGGSGGGGQSGWQTGQSSHGSWSGGGQPGWQTGQSSQGSWSSSGQPGRQTGQSSHGSWSSSGQPGSQGSWSSSGQSEWQTGQGSHGGSRGGGQSGWQTGQIGAHEDLCGDPVSPKIGMKSCMTRNGEKTCEVSCAPGYKFPDGSHQARHVCNMQDGTWSPKKDFDECVLTCHPPCENGGTCAANNICRCPSGFRGIRCEYPTSLCDIQHLSTVIAECKHLQEYTECKISCPPGQTFDPPSASIYRCTVDGKWNPPTAPKCKSENLCPELPRPNNANVSCRASPNVKLCSAECRPGYRFKNGFTTLTTQCNKNEGIWTPYDSFTDCEPTCNPECMNGGQCLGHNMCLCPKEFRGSQCEYPLSNCDANDRFASVAWQCKMNDKETVCNISCGSTGGKLQPPEPNVYTCSLDGTWQPDLKPICISDFSNMNRGTGGFHQTHVTRQTSSSSHSSSGQANFGGQSTTFRNYSTHGTGGGQFGGQTSVDYDIYGQRPLGGEFTGQESVDYSIDNIGGQGGIGTFREPTIAKGGSQVVLQGRPPSRQQQGKEEFDVHLAKGGAKKGSHLDKFQLPDEDSELIIKNSGIDSDFSMFMKKDRASNYRGICSVWGFYHYRTFDGDVYTFPSTCWYILAVSSSDEAVISARSDCHGNSPCLREVSIQLGNYRYVLSYDKGLTRNGETLSIPIQDGDLLVEYISRYLVARTNSGYEIWINDENSVLVVAEPYVQSQTTGLCGNYDGYTGPLFTTREGLETDDIYAFATSWKMEDPDGECIDNAEAKMPCSAETTDKRMASDKANLKCAAFYDVQFRECKEVVNSDLYYTNCQMDCCNADSVESCECSSLGEFVLECTRTGVDMSNGWRQPGLCPLQCTNGTEYRECGPACPPTCSDLEPTCQQQKCIDGCHCPLGTVLESGNCIPVDECPCHYGEKFYASGEKISQDCNQCICQGGSWKCTESLCPATCSVAGPHFTTFDGSVYDYQGTCPHFLVNSEEFDVQVDYGRNCKGELTMYDVCVKGITIHTEEKAVVKLKPSKEVTVNGREMTSLPVTAPGIYIGQATSTHMRAVLKNGLEIIWDLDSTVHVYAPVELFGKVNGLCGTFTKNQQDEFLTPEGDVETSIEAFAQKWKVEEDCIDDYEIISSEIIEGACDERPERRSSAAEVCRVIKGPEFKECHDLIDYERYYADCMEDVCSCQEDPWRCVCLSLANYASACAKKGKALPWRQSVPACGVACPLGQVYLPCATPCSYSCEEVAHSYTNCRESCVEGCVCPPGQTLNDHDQCVPVSSCSCLYSGHFYPPDFMQRRGKEMCECSQGHWDCHEASTADLLLTPPPNIAPECDPSSHEEPTECMSKCPVTCSNYHNHEPCTMVVCVPGCRCQEGYILDTSTDTCVLPHDCPCHHAGRTYDEGEKVNMDCNSCVCEGGSWNCETKTCPGLCSAWGDSHYVTFDGKIFDFEGSCDYVLAKAHVSGTEIYSVIVQNVLCGTGSGATCGKSVTVSLGDSAVKLTRAHPLPLVPENSKLSVTGVGMFTLVNSDIGISVQWDRNSRVYVTAQPVWKGKLQGLCGDFNSDSTDDFRSPSGGVPLVLAKDFADSWRVHKFCANAKQPQDACELYPERRSWARQKCDILKSELFEPCHYQVQVDDYYKRCVLDACACNSGGDCKCLCAVVAAYAQKCARSGVVISWRSQELCPVQCEACDRYSPCISLCPPPNCETYLNPPESQSCAHEYCVDGCEPKPCKPGYVHKSGTNTTCVSEESCDQKPCIVVNGIEYREGERLREYEEADECQSCYCRHGLVDCIGVPCSVPIITTVPSVFIEVTPSCDLTGWTDWINSVNPNDNSGSDIESLIELVEDSRIPCPLEYVKDIQCRVAETQEPAGITREGVRCDATHGLMCMPDPQMGDCLDYEIRVYCSCEDIVLEEPTCPPDQELLDCAFDCENSCHSLVRDLKTRGECQTDKCVKGCVKKTCEYPYVARDAEVCVRPDECTCKLDSGYLLAPGEVQINGCEKCQCLNNSLICHVTLECQEIPKVAPTIMAVPPPPSRTAPPPIVINVTLVETPTKRPRPTPPIPGEFIVETTTPACSYWSDWINKRQPRKGKKQGEREDTRPYILTQTEGFCLEGTVTAIQCRDALTDQDYSQTNEEKLMCDLDKGFICQNRHQPDLRCRDYKIRYYCECGEETTETTYVITPSTSAYVYPCAEFMPMIEGEHPLPDKNLKASSSDSPLSGPDAARFESRNTNGAWTAGEDNEKQFIEVDLDEVRGVYGIVTKGKEDSSEWVTSFQLLYSKDGNSYSYYQDEKDNNKIFNANYDDKTEVKHIFKRPFEARLVRLEPLTWEEQISLKLELLGCSEALTTTKALPPPSTLHPPLPGMEIPTTTTPPPPKECKDPMGLENGILLDSQFSASSSFDSVFGPEYSKLGSGSVWASADLDDQQYLQVDFLDEANVTGVVTKGREDITQYVTAYTVAHSKDGNIWNQIEDETGNAKEFPANYDPYSTVTNEFPATIRTRYLRISPIRWKNWISMNIEVLGCYSPQPCRDPMGIDEGIISKHQLTASSEMSKIQSPSNGRLSSSSAWTPSKFDKGQYLQVDLMEPTKVTAVVTKGDPNAQQWVLSYYVGHSNDSENWTKVKDHKGEIVEFQGNSDQHSPVINLLPIPIRSRYVRILPLKWHRWTGLRMELLGCVHEQECRDPMGLENGVLSDAQITASSSMDWKTTPDHARISDDSGWVANRYDREHFLQVDFLEDRNISAIVTKGVEPEDSWVTKFKILIADSPNRWYPLIDDAGDVVVFPGNEDSDTPVVNTFPNTVEARYFRIVPMDYKNQIGLRLELLGCYHPYVCQEPMGMETREILDFQITASSSMNPLLKASNGRFDSETAWVPELHDDAPYIQVDLIEPTNVTGLMTLGRGDSNQWVTKYEVAFSDDEATWNYLEDEFGNTMVFKANTNNEAPVTNTFPVPVVSRFVRIYPTDFKNGLALRFEILGCAHEKGCMEPMGLENGLLPDGYITASSQQSDGTQPALARLNSPSAWSPITVDEPQFLQVDFGDLQNVSAVVTKGNPEEPEWVSSYKVFYSKDGDEWIPVENKDGDPIEFPGNTDNDSPVVNVLPETIATQFIRIVPTDWKNWISLRAEILGCYHPYEETTLPTEPPYWTEQPGIPGFYVTPSPPGALPPAPYRTVPPGPPGSYVTPPPHGTLPPAPYRTVPPGPPGSYETPPPHGTLPPAPYRTVPPGPPGSYVTPPPHGTSPPAPYRTVPPGSPGFYVSTPSPFGTLPPAPYRTGPPGLPGIYVSPPPHGTLPPAPYRTEPTSPSVYVTVPSRHGTVTPPPFEHTEYVPVIDYKHSTPYSFVFPPPPFRTTPPPSYYTVPPRPPKYTIPGMPPIDYESSTPYSFVFTPPTFGTVPPPLYGTTMPPEEVLAKKETPTEPPPVAKCPNGMELEDTLLKDSRIVASSSTPGGRVSRIPLYTRGTTGLSGGWVPSVDDLHPFLLVELPEEKWLTSITLQGRQDEENWVKSFRVISSQDNVTWLPVYGEDGDEVIPGNVDQNKPVKNFFLHPTEAQFVKIIPETWHRWPSFRMDLQGCHMPSQITTTVTPGAEELKMCPELVDDIDLAANCPEYCPDGTLCDGEKCVDPVDCVCMHEGRLMKVSDRIEDNTCRECDCALGGRTICTEKICPPCPQYERSKLGDDCTCSCQACDEGEVMCPSRHECIPKQRWCDGIVDCGDDEKYCVYTTTPIPSGSLVTPTEPPEPENATCDVMGKHIKTFDGQDITYDICHHTVMRDIAKGVFNVSLHKECDFDKECKHWMELKFKKHNVTVFSDLKVEYNGHSYTASQLTKIGNGQKTKAKNLIIKRIGEKVSIKAINKGFTLIYDNKGHLKIEVMPLLLTKISGLCGFYSDKLEDDQQKPDGKKAYTSQEFGDSWAVEDSDKDCTPIICSHDIMAKAFEQCNKLREEPFGECSQVVSVDQFRDFCMSSMCECMLQKNNTVEKCKCDSFQPFTEACEAKLGPAAIRNWRFKHECRAECPLGMEWNDCGPSCQLTCDSNSETSALECSEKCVPGCFCRPGTVLHDEKCIPADQCADQTCQGFGDPHFKTFDGLLFPFQAEGSFLIVGDKDSDFVLKGISRRCSMFSKITCLVGLDIVYKGHEVIVKKHKEVNVDGEFIPMDKLPSISNGMVILGYPGKTYVVFIPEMNLEARYYEDNSGFAVKVPSRKYFNKTKGLCGNCNGKKDDELGNEPLNKFVCSWQTEGDPEECEESMKELPEFTGKVPMCERLENPVFEACYPLVDVDIYVDACSFDATQSGEPKAALCKTAMEYGRQCCQAGTAIDNWPAELGCDIECPEGLKYKQCHKGCPQTCVSVKNASETTACSELKTDGCFCPDGKIVKDGECVDTLLCETCDEEGHVPGDEWQEENCKKCSCRSDLSTECVIEVCPAKPVCSTDETLAKISSEKEETSCCETYTCVPKKSNCPPMDVPDCPKGEVAKIRMSEDGCNDFECECDPALCSPVVWPSDLEVGQEAEMINESCCPKIKVVCHPSSCPKKPNCRKGLELIENEGECCTSYKCKPPEDVCIYTPTNKIIMGLQVEVGSIQTTQRIYKPNEEWQDGVCEKCKCVESNGQHVPLCVLEQCPRVEDMPENKEYVLHELTIPGKCCPDIFRIQCKDEDGNVYETGEQWNDFDNPCINYICELKETGDVQKTKSVMNCTECPRTATYFPPSKILGQCCGVCRISKCEDGDELYSVGDTWVSQDQPCRKSECIQEFDIVKTIYTKQPCPTIPEDCPENKIVWDESGCCEICNVTSAVGCSTGPIPENETVGFFKFRDDNNGGLCVNEQPVPGVMKCAGACHSNSFYSLEDGDFKDNCKCCKVNVTVDRIIELVCPNGNYITKTFIQPETCQCSKCAPKNYNKIPPWQQPGKPDRFTQNVWQDSGRFSQSQQEEEDNINFIQQNPFERFGQQEQQSFDNNLDTMVQQQDYDFVQQQQDY